MAEQNENHDDNAVIITKVLKKNNKTAILSFTKRELASVTFPDTQPARIGDMIEMRIRLKKRGAAPS